jgi:hypothetical protein
MKTAKTWRNRIDDAVYHQVTRTSRAYVAAGVRTDAGAGALTPATVRA